MHGCGDYMGPSAFGHIGYTGTSLWIDPDRELFVILLTNRVHAARARRPAKVIADIRDDLADAAAWAVVDDPEVAVQKVAFRADTPKGWNKPLRAKRSRNRRGAGKGKAAVKTKALGTRGPKVSAGRKKGITKPSLSTKKRKSVGPSSSRR
jgi:hypothetical protein